MVEIAQSVAHHARTSSRVGLFARFLGAGAGAYDSPPELDRRAMDFLLLLLNNLQREGVVTLPTGLTHSSSDSAATNGANLEIARSGAIRIVRALGDDPGLTPQKRAQRVRKNSDLPDGSITTLASRVERLATPPSGSTRKCLLDDFLNCAVSVWLEDHLRRRRKLQEIFSMCVARAHRAALCMCARRYCASALRPAAASTAAACSCCSLRLMLRLQHQRTIAHPAATHHIPTCTNHCAGTRCD